jgi:hypothetical protein
LSIAPALVLVEIVERKLFAPETSWLFGWANNRQWDHVQTITIGADKQGDPILCPHLLDPTIGSPLINADIAMAWKPFEEEACFIRIEIFAGALSFLLACGES